MIAPGIYSTDELSNADYHAEPDYLSSSRLKAALPTYTDPDNPEALAFGTLVHSVVLEPSRLDAEYVVLDPKKVGVNKDGSESQNPLNTSAWKAAVEEVRSSGKTLVSPEDWDKAHRMAESVGRHKEAAQLLLHGTGVYEESVFWVDENGTGHKARFDRRVPGAVVDLKSTSSPLSDDKLAEAIDAYLYHLSAVHYLAGAKAHALDADAFCFVFVSKWKPHHVRVIDLTDAFLYEGQELRERALDLALNGQHGWSTLAPPRWSRHKIGDHS